ncbi:Fpg/Nei family DNA glycosylase [Phycicoccus sonneratiae]|uniref:DNA-(apurinic or apyrimidinic site) lyase n=1 Tax=Phycicoccus sonneratiae TaxID=2807628 RepID=A0ABS2CMZ3_9MICO|nr:Fpg/Nei family DNA glycosylase [Phycicoccus sonneraticus]MBM6401198.1 Fpg/Nei family DNA glycosylase [Phycicoccus sonneraticus]
MPEGHTLHALAGRVDAAFAGTAVRFSSPQGRFAGSAAALDGARVEGAEAHGKHLAIRVEGARVVHVHLGLFGRFSVRRHRRVDRGEAPTDLPLTGQVRLRMVNRTHVGDLRGPIVCELVTDDGWEEVRSGLGADPLREERLPDAVLARLARSRRAVGAVLMDQGLVAGVGNVYRAELLHRHGLDPHTPAREVPQRVVHELWDDLVRLMPLGVRTGRILVADDDVERARTLLADGGTGRVRPAYAVYRRHGRTCPRCGGTVVKETMAGRNLFWCPGCQR